VEQLPSTDLTRPESTGTALISTSRALGLPFVDTNEHALDAKLRLTLPSGVRADFVDGGLLVLWSGPCIAVLTEAGFARWIRFARQAIPAAGYDDPAGTIRYAHSQASRFKPDVQGRFQLADRLRFAVGIDRDVTIVGAGSRLELWNPATYGADLVEHRANLAFHQDQYDLLGEDV